VSNSFYRANYKENAMKAPYEGLKRKWTFFSNARDPYKKLRDHLNRQAAGYPATLTGVELRLLKDMFTVEEAQAALFLDYTFQPFDTIFSRAQSSGMSQEKLQTLLDAMEKKGDIFMRIRDGKPFYALHPLVIGMFEMQLKRLTPSYYLDTHNYMIQRLAMDYLTAEVPQMRVVPVNRSLTPTQNIATYDQIRAMVDRAKDKIGIADCICKVGKDMVGDPCKVTDRREICMGFRDFYDQYDRNNWGRSISKEEAFEILDQNEKEGLVLFASNMQDLQFVCSCCSCCCGIMEMVSFMPRPVDFTASNYFAELNSDACNGCKKCIRRCHMKAIVYDEGEKKATAIDLKRCIGCGLCVPTCKQNAIRLKLKATQFIPPMDHDGLYERIMKYKRSGPRQYYEMGKSLVGLKRSQSRK